MPAKTVTRAAWLAARLEHLEAEKDFTRARDALSAARRALPRVRIDKDYVFDTPSGSRSLAALFEGKQQLIVYHFMYGTDWDQGCTSCSFWVDNFDGITTHLAQRDTTLLLVSKAPLPTLLTYRERMGWTSQWVSSQGKDFSEDFQVTFSREARDAGEVTYNYRKTPMSTSDMPGISVFSKGPDAAVYHCYSTYSRGLDMLNGAYHLLDLTPKGRDEDDLPHPMSWLMRRDEYPDGKVVA